MRHPNSPSQETTKFYEYTRLYHSCLTDHVAIGDPFQVYLLWMSSSLGRMRVRSPAARVGVKLTPTRSRDIQVLPKLKIARPFGVTRSSSTTKRFLNHRHKRILLLLFLLLLPSTYTGCLRKKVLLISMDKRC